MAKCYEQTWRSLPANGAERNDCWTLDFPSEGILKKVVVRQVGGASSDFDLDIFNSAKVCSTGSLSSGGGGDPHGDYAGDPDDYRVVNTLHADTPGRLVKIYEDTGPMFTNRDGVATTKQRKIYLQITPALAGPMTFDVTLSIMTDVGY